MCQFPIQAMQCHELQEKNVHFDDIHTDLTLFISSSSLSNSPFQFDLSFSFHCIPLLALWYLYILFFFDYCKQCWLSEAAFCFDLLLFVCKNWIISNCFQCLLIQKDWHIIHLNNDVYELLRNVKRILTENPGDDRIWVMSFHQRQLKIKTTIADRDGPFVGIEYAHNHVKQQNKWITHKMQLLVGVKCLNRCHLRGDMLSAPTITNNKQTKPTELNAHGKGHGQSKIQKFSFK